MTDFNEILAQAKKLAEAAAQMRGHLDLAGREKQIAEIEEKTVAPNFWDDPPTAQKVLAEIARKKREIAPWLTLFRKIDDLAGLAELALEEADEATAQEVANGLLDAEAQLEKMETQALLSGEYDGHNALLAINAGAGGTESCDWVDILSRMYMRWAEKRGFAVEVIDRVPGEQAGSKSITISIEGSFAYGYLRSERGVHRLVRISPFDASARRHTSFASVDILPEVEQDDEIDIPPEDIKMDTFRSAGAGGQNVQKNDTAVRLTHIPTGIVVSCQNERSQGRNRDSAMKVLMAKLLAIKRNEQDEKLSKLRGETTEISWGNQIRSYVLQPYTLVKDNRTNLEIGNAAAVLDGEIDAFLDAYLRFELGENKA